MISTAILGASGYAGGELIRILDGNPSFEVTLLGAHGSAGKLLGEVHPQLSGGDRLLEAFDANRFGAVDLVFLALPHGASADPAVALAARGAAVVDLGSDFRLDRSERYVEAYGAPHAYPDQLGSWAYGIPELFGADIATSRTVAAPGCYPTSVLVGVGPLVRDGLVDAEGIIVDAMSGVSGAGRGVDEALMFGSVDESVKAYKVLQHRHQPEMERALDALTGGSSQVLFTPHLVPMQRGILSTIHLSTADGVGHDDLTRSLDDAYGSATFVRRIEEPPQTRWVVGSNNALVSVHVDERSGRAIVLSAIDNLVKGASGQAVQCANLMLGLPEAEGLPTTGWMP
jgi:N-acetyl-gamma-glutamyl-phosphate reductase